MSVRDQEAQIGAATIMQCYAMQGSSVKDHASTLVTTAWAPQCTIPARECIPDWKITFSRYCMQSK